MTLKQFAIDIAAKDLMLLESEFRRFADEHDDVRGRALHHLARELGNLVSYATNPPSETGETLTAEWLEETKRAINTATLNAEAVVEMDDRIYSRLPSARSLGLQLARLLWEVNGETRMSKSTATLVKVREIADGAMFKHDDRIFVKCRLPLADSEMCNCLKWLGGSFTETAFGLDVEVEPYDGSLIGNDNND